jgi:hypothetical protein
MDFSSCHDVNDHRRRQFYGVMDEKKVIFLGVIFWLFCIYLFEFRLGFMYICKKQSRIATRRRFFCQTFSKNRVSRAFLSWKVRFSVENGNPYKISIFAVEIQFRGIEFKFFGKIHFLLAFEVCSKFWLRWFLKLATYLLLIPTTKLDAILRNYLMIYLKMLQKFELDEMSHNFLMLNIDGMWIQLFTDLACTSISNHFYILPILVRILISYFSFFTHSNSWLWRWHRTDDSAR